MEDTFKSYKINSVIHLAALKSINNSISRPLDYFDVNVTGTINLLNVMNLNGVSVFLDFVQKIWNPLIVPLITVLIISSIINGINSWWRRKLLGQEEDI